MIFSYCKAAIRLFRRNKAFSAIHVLGLAIGISAAMVIFLIVRFEFGFDRFEKDADRIYRVVIDARFNGSEGHSAAVPSPLSGAVEREVTGISKTVPVMQFPGDATAKVSVERESGKQIIFKKQPDIVFTNGQYFQLLPFHWVAGSPRSALSRPFSVVLTKSRANLYFPGLSPAQVLGKELTYNDITVTVSGIVSDLNERTAFKATDFISYPTIDKTNLRTRFMMDVWNDWMIYSQLYVKIAKGDTPADIESQLKGILRKYDRDANRDAAHTMAFHLQPLKDIHFDSKYQGIGYRTVKKSMLYGLSAIAAFLLLLGCINFINLSTAQASQRAREIGVRKTMGGSRKQLVIQFLCETFLTTLAATVFSVILTPLLLKMFENFIPAGLHFNLRHQPSLWIFLVLLILGVTLLAGLYPAFVLSGLRPSRVLKNQAFSNRSQTRSAWLRKTFTVSQFVIAQFFVIATVVVSKQIYFSLHADLGFTKEAIINFDLPGDTVSVHGRQLLSQIRSLSGVSVASSGFFAPAGEGVAFTNLSYRNGKKVFTPNTQIRWGNPDYIRVYQLKLVAGRNVRPSDTVREFLVNESYAHAIGFTHASDAVGKTLLWNGKSVPIVGILKDFHDQSMRAPISPVVFGGANGSTMHIRLKPDNATGSLWKNTIAAIGKDYRQLYPDESFKYHFLDETIAHLYENDVHTASLLKWATVLAILISCLGLLGLVIYTTNLRRKEIGIRKVLGASVGQIVSILSIDFISLVLIAFMIAVPVAWWAAHHWLEGFVYKTAISWWIFLLSGLIMVLIALLTLSLQTVKTALANPVDSLRVE